MPAAAISSSMEVAAKPFSSTDASVSARILSRASPRFLGLQTHVQLYRE